MHGFISSANSSNSYKLAKSLVEHGANVFSLDWAKAACTTGLPIIKFTGYPRAVQNTREIGEFMAKYVISLIENCNIALKNITFIGHSLGSHVSGFASKKIQNSGYGLIPRLIGADPAQPLFTFKGCEERLCDTDAEKVIILHTSALGISRAIGHTDLYFGYRFMQPGCFINVACSHTRSVVYLTTVLENPGCKFPGVSQTSSTSSPAAANCIVMDDGIFKSNHLKSGSYSVSVKSKEFCTQDFSCE